MVNPKDITIELYWDCSLEEQYRLQSEYRILNYKIQDTFKYLDELIKEYEKIENQLINNIKIK